MSRFSVFLIYLFVFLSFDAFAQTPLRNLVCINVNPQDQFVDRRTRFGMTRNFHLFRDDIANSNGGQCPPASGFPEKIRWNPSRNGNKYISFDDFYSESAQRNLAVLHGNAPFMNGGLFGKPICPDVASDLSKHEDPGSYLLNSIRASLFGARYGTAPSGGFPTGFDQIASRYVETPDNQMGQGLGTVGYIEIFNEADNSWSDNLGFNYLDLYPNQPTTYYFSPRQYAAMLSAAYDGNCSSAGFEIKDANGNDVPNAFWGINNLAPGVKVVMAGTADLRKKWLSDLVDWCQAHRSACQKPLPFDVVNYHFYTTPSHPSHTALSDATKWDEFYNGKRTFEANIGTYPEASNIDLKNRFTFVLNDQPDQVKTLPVWITEFGYSSDGGGQNQSALDPQTIQAQWLTRYVLETSAVRDGDGRGIDRLFLYELNNDITVPGFTYYGIQGLDGSPKKAWFHLMTMLNVLGDYWYLRNNSGPNTEQFFLDSDPNTALPADDPRIYLYGNSSTNSLQRTYALWVPHNQNLHYPGKLLIPGTWQTKPKVQKIEVLDYDEDGKRTMVPDADVEWTAGSSSIVVKNLNLGETPMYLRFVQSPFSDPVVPEISYLNAQCYGCQRIRLTWTAPVNAHYTFYQVYYARKAEYPVDPATQLPLRFDLAFLHLYGDKLSGNANSIYVSLPPDEYFFWVVPYRTVYDFSLGRHVMVAPDLSADFTPYFVQIDATDCISSPCAASLSPANITNMSVTHLNGTVTPTFGNSYYQQGFMEALMPISTANICDEMNGGAPSYSSGVAPGILLSPNPLDPNAGVAVSFVVNFSPPQFINAIQMYLSGGRGEITIEFMEDCCSAFYEVKTYKFGGPTPQWVTLTNSSPKKRIDKVRITIRLAEIDGGGVTIGRLLFCTEPATERCREGEGDESFITSSTTAPSDLQVDNIDTHSAQLSFQPATRAISEETSVEPEPVYAHKVRYGIALDERGEILQAKEVSVRSEDYGMPVSRTLSGLAPNTTYIVDVLATVACNELQTQSSRIIFTTLAESDGQERSAPLANSATAAVRLSPNPVQDRLHLEIPEGGFSEWRIMSIDGTLLGRGEFSASAHTADIDVSRMPAGILVVALFGEGRTHWSQGFLKMD